LVKELGADVNQADTIGRTPLNYAALAGDTDVMHCLAKEFGADVNLQHRDGCSPLYAAAQYGRMDAVRFLANELGADVEQAAPDNGSTPLFVASQENFVKFIRCLVEFGADVNHLRHDGCSPLCIAAGKARGKGSIDAVRCLVTEFDADACSQSKSPSTGTHPISQIDVRPLIFSGSINTL
jgi:ankyrin repeat protein